MKWAVVVGIVSLGVACSKDAAGPPPAPANIGGAWNLSVTASNGAVAVTCELRGAVMTLSMSGDTFTGSHASGEILCNGISGGVVSGPVVNGVIGRQQQPASVAFDLGTADLHQVGTWSAGSMSGSATWRLTDPATGVVTVFTGPWSAQKR
jgi:hypothetical protein